jgi:hypothetical protein
LGQLRDRGTPSFLARRHVEKPEELADAPYRLKPNPQWAAFASVPVVKATREGTARARALGVDRACASVVQRRERRTRLLEGRSSLEHFEVFLVGATNLVGREGDAPEEGSIATETTRPT